MITKAIAVWLAICALIVVGRLTASDATFTAQKANSGNDFAAAATFPGMRLATGTYTGNGGDSRAITGVGFAPDVVIVKGNTNQVAVIRTATMSGDATKLMVGATALTTNLIQSLDSNGFTVGTNSRVNASGTAYYWTAFKASEGAMTIGSYTGNNGSQSIGNVGFAPEAAVVLAASAQRAQIGGGGRSFQFDANTGITNGITTLDSDGFSVGNSATVNSSGITYHYIAWNAVPGSIEVAGYTGNGADNRNLTLGLTPQYVIVRSTDTTTGREGAHRPSSLGGTGSLNFSAAANDTNSIQALQTNGMQLGTDTSVNANGAQYGYLAFRDQP